MSMASLPNYVAPTFSRTPSYTAEPQAHEQRIALASRPRPSGEFIKQSKDGEISLRLIGQQNNLSLPVYGAGGAVEGNVDLSKCDGVARVEVKIEGRLRVREIAEGDTMASKLCLDTAVLWARGRRSGACPPSLPFLLRLPATYAVGGATYPLPPTYEAHLSGLPGFQASIDYAVSATVAKPSGPSFARPTLAALNVGRTVVSTPFVYFPRSRPAAAVPAPMARSPQGPVEAPEWHTAEMSGSGSGLDDVVCQLHLPALRMHCLREPIPFYLTLRSSAAWLAANLRFGPTARQPAPAKRPLRVQLLRESTADVRGARGAFGVRAKRDVRRVDAIGEGAFGLKADGPGWVTFGGEIRANADVRVGGFTAGGFTVKVPALTPSQDCIVLSVCPLEPHRSPFTEIRLTVAVRLTTDAFTPENGAGLGAHDDGATYSVPDDGAQPELPYA